MALTPDFVKYGEASLVSTGTLGGTATLTATHASGTTWPNAHAETASITVNVTEVTAGTGPPSPYWGIAVVEDVSDSAGDYTVTGAVLAWVAIGTSPSPATPINIAGLNKGGTYRLVVTAGDSAANSQDINAVTGGATSAEYHMDSDGYEERGSLAPTIGTTRIGGAGHKLEATAVTPTAGNWKYGQTNQIAISLRPVVRPYDVTSSKYTGNSFSISSEESTPTGITFNNDGTKFFITGFASSAVHEYTVSSPYDLGSTVTYTGNSFSVASEESTPSGITFNNDGTKFFVIGSATDAIYEYTLSVAFDLGSTVAYTGNSFSVASEDTNPTGLAFSDDGTKFFIVGTVSDRVYEYTLSVAFDLGSTVTYTGNSFSVSGGETSPRSVVFNNDGTKFFIIGASADKVHEYTVSSPYDLGSTVTYTGNSFSVASQDDAPLGQTFNNDGTKFFIIGNTTDAIYEYIISGQNEQLINPKQFKVALSTDAAGSTRPDGVYRITPNTTGDVTATGIRVDTDFNQTVGGVGHYTQIGVNNTLGDSSTPAAEQAGIWNIAGATVEGVTTSQRAAFVFTDGAVTTQISDSQMRSDTADVTISAAIQIFEDAGQVTAGVAPFATSGYATRQDIFKRTGPTLLTDARPYLECYVFDAYDNPLVSTAVTARVLRTVDLSQENSQNLTTDANGRIRWNYTIANTDPAFSEMIKPGTSRQANGHVSTGPDNETGWTYTYTNGNPQDPATYGGPFYGYPRDVEVEGRVFTTKEPADSDTDVFGVNSEGFAEGTWAGSLTAADLDVNGVPQGAGRPSQILGSGSLKVKPASKIDPASLRVVDLGRHALRDGAGREIVVTTDSWFLRSAVFNDTTDAVIQGPINLNDAQTKLENSLAYNANNNSLDTIDPPTDPAALKYFVGFADTTTQRTSFDVTVSGTDPVAGFTADVGNFGYRQLITSFQALDASVAAIMATETIQSGPLLTRRFTFQAIRVAADVAVNPDTAFNAIDTDGAPAYAVFAQPSDGGALEIIETGLMSPIDVAPTGDWFFDLQLPLGFKMVKVYAVATVAGSPIVGGDKLPVQIGFTFDAKGTMTGLQSK